MVRRMCRIQRARVASRLPRVALELMPTVSFGRAALGRERSGFGGVQQRLVR